jgi:hypothetical protein
VRLALLGYDEPILPPFVDQVRLETTSAIERADLVEFFQSAFRDRGLTVAPAVVDRAADLVWTKLPVEERERLRTLNELVRDAVERLFPAVVAT